MSELTAFTNKLAACDLIVLTSFNKDHTYCRFFLNGIYMGSMHLFNPVILGRLQQLSGAGDEITAGGVAKLIKIFVGV
ncbi:hypothetical protein [Pontibacter pamirensis]|uniref:hypothetical protein n=1 Tax=Pontibacter pamirensis TaxID=2562824 RepID=UPI001389AAD2|nr:hypothetical protein [Pontibacter pamirensis]